MLNKLCDNSRRVIRERARSGKKKNEEDSRAWWHMFQIILD